jgi:ribonuclease VapC
MIVVDSSVVVAILQREPDAPTWIEVFDKTSKALMSVVSFVETSMVICGRRPDPDPREITSLLDVLGIDIVPVTPKQGETAVAAFLRYGKGRHRAGLNLADCFSYALAKVQGAPLLYKGNDFGLTDLIPARQSQ